MFNKIFSKLYRTRIKVTKDTTPIVNLSLLFVIISALLAIWLVVIGAVAALLLGYRFAIEKDSPDFSGDIKEIAQDASENVQNVVKNFSRKDEM